MKKSLIFFPILFVFTSFLMRLRIFDPSFIIKKPLVHITKADFCSNVEDGSSIVKEADRSQNFMIVGCGGFI